MRLPLSLLLAAGVAGCGPKTATPDAASSASSLTATASADGVLTGPVLEQLAASPYLYLRLKTSRGELWAAIPEAMVETGAVVTVVNPILMTKFASTSLNRTFDEVYFGTLASDGAAIAAPGGDPHAGVPQSATAVTVGRVEKASGPGARTVSEVWAQKASLEGKPVTLRGVVVKVNNGVMGKNWIHLQDGSGDTAQGTDDITVTSMDQASPGQTVTIKGTVRTDKDFGAGYVYKVMVEDATIVKSMR